MQDALDEIRDAGETMFVCSSVCLRSYAFSTAFVPKIEISTSISISVLFVSLHWPREDEMDEISNFETCGVELHRIGYLIHSHQEFSCFHWAIS